MKALSNIAAALPVSAALAVDLAAKSLAAIGRDVVSFCVGEPDFDAPEPAKRAGIACIESNGMRYTNASGTPELRAAVAAALARDCGLAYEPDAIAVTTGAKYAVYAAALALVNPGDEVILPAPYWTSYEHIVRLTGGVPVVVPCAMDAGWKLTPTQLDRAVTKRTKALIFNNPNNPSGAVYTRIELSALAEICRKHDLYVIADEIYRSLVYTGEPFCAAASVNADMFARTVTVGGVSKAYAMTGWRIGFAAGPRAVLRAVSAILSHTTGSPNAAAQAAACEALAGPQAETARMRETFLQRRNALLLALSSVPGVRYTVPDGAFYVLLDISGLLKGGRWADASAFALGLLHAEGVATVPCADYGAPDCVRLSYTLPEHRMLEGVRPGRRHGAAPARAR